MWSFEGKMVYSAHKRNGTSVRLYLLPIFKCHLTRYSSFQVVNRSPVWGALASRQHFRTALK